jgi:hypothetical protein
MKHFNATHELSYTREYAAWNHMIDRCTNEKCQDWPEYGARGIKVSKRWLDVRKFVEDMGSRPDGTSLDRIDGTKGYCKSNCRWANAKQQSNNRRTNRVLEYKGERKTIAEWSDLTGIPYFALYFRVTRLGWPIDKALTTPLKVNSRHKS